MDDSEKPLAVETGGEAPSREPGRPHAPWPPVSTTVTAMMALILAAGIGILVWLEMTIPRIERVAAPEQALSLVVSRNLEVEEAIRQAPAWERWFYETTTETGGNTLSESIGWYRELSEVSLNATLHLELAILEAEAGRLEDVRAEISLWDDLDDPFPTFSALVDAAYLSPSVSSEDAEAALASAAEALPAGWFYDRLAIALATKGRQEAFLATLRQTIAARDERLLSKVRWLTVIEGTVILAGLITLGLMLRRGRIRVAEAAVPPPWPGWLGVTVLVRGGALGLLIALAVLFLDVDHPVVRLLSMPLAAVPVIVLAEQYLLAPVNLGFRRGFGLWPVHRPMTGLMAMLAVLAAGLIGEWVLGVLADYVSWSSHWTEWFDGDLVWGDPVTLAISLTEFILFAPFFEELVFRGLLFATLRRRFSWPVAAATSAGFFAVAHGYGVLGLISVFWSGILWAWVYERTGSLWPNILGHAINNLLVCLSLMYLLRW